MLNNGKLLSLIVRKVRKPALNTNYAARNQKELMTLVYKHAD